MKKGLFTQPSLAACLFFTNLISYSAGRLACRLAGRLAFTTAARMNSTL